MLCGQLQNLILILLYILLDQYFIMKSANIKSELPDMMTLFEVISTDMILQSQKPLSVLYVFPADLNNNWVYIYLF